MRTLIVSFVRPWLNMMAGRRWTPRCVSAFSDGLGGRVSKLLGNSGVKLITMVAGEGDTFPKKGQIVVVHYTGTLEDGSKVDSSRDRKTPFRFRVGQGDVIKGLDYGVVRMSVGQRAKIICSPRFAYGSTGHPGLIPPNSILIIDVELLKVE